MENGEFLEKRPKMKKRSYVLKRVIENGQVLIAASIPGEGKTLFFLTGMYHIPYEAPFLGEPTELGNIIIVDSENKWGELTGHIARMKKGLEMDGYVKKGRVDIQHYTKFLFDDEETWPPLHKVIEEFQPVAIMFDHLRRFHNQQEDSSTGMAKVTDGILAVQAICGSAVLVMHHFNKTDTGSFFKRLRGSSAIYADSDKAYEVRTLFKKNIGGLNAIETIGIIEQSRKGMTGQPFRVRVEDGDDWMKIKWDGTYQPVEDPRMDKIAHKIYHIFIEDKEEKTVDSIIKTLAKFASDGETRACLRHLDDMGLLLSERSGRSHKLGYTLPSRMIMCPWCSKPK